MGLEACNNYYERLGVDKAAGAQQIKRAYYTLVKQFPPERFPEEYKSLRAAYDTLSDEKSRADYDSGQLLPKGAVALMAQAKKLDAVGWHTRSAEVYEQVLRMYPGLEQAMTALAIAYEEQDKNGKAASLWEKLCARDPKNAVSAYRLARAYERRSWRKKAIAQYKRALELDDGNADCWMALLNCLSEYLTKVDLREFCEQGILALRSRNRESIRLYAHMAYYSAPANMDAAERCLGEIVRILRAGDARDCDPETIVQFLLEQALQQKYYSFIPYIRKMSEAVAIKDSEFQDALNKAFRVPDIIALGKRGFSKKLQILIDTLNYGCDCDNCRLNKLSLEYFILEEGEAGRAGILRLREEFPNLYALHADFFGEVLRSRDMKKLLYRREKALSKEGITPDWSVYDEASDLSGVVDQAGVASEPAFEPAAAKTMPKTGRNDPCPCGSGKKYKNCCGKL